MEIVFSTADCLRLGFSWEILGVEPRKMLLGCTLEASWLSCIECGIKGMYEVGVGGAISGSSLVVSYLVDVLAGSLARVLRFFLPALDDGL